MDKKKISLCGTHSYKNTNCVRLEVVYTIILENSDNGIMECKDTYMMRMDMLLMNYKSTSN